MKGKTSFITYHIFLSIFSAICYHTDYGLYTMMPARIAKYCLNWSSVSPGWVLLVFQENVFRESPSYSDFLLEVSSVLIFSIIS